MMACQTVGAWKFEEVEYFAGREGIRQSHSCSVHMEVKP